jgi:hypothetical protein
MSHREQIVVIDGRPDAASRCAPPARRSFNQVSLSRAFVISAVKRKEALHLYVILLDKSAETDLTPSQINL